MVTHDQSEALALSSRIAVFNKGNLEQVGSPQQVYDHPLTAFSATFIGRSNLLPVSILQADQQSLKVALGERSLVCPRTASSAKLQVGDKAHLCFKPEAVAIRCGDDEDSPNSLLCTLLGRSYQGSMVDLRLQLTESEGAPIRAVVSAAQAASLPDGGQLTLNLSPSTLSVIAHG